MALLGFLLLLIPNITNAAAVVPTFCSNPSSIGNIYSTGTDVGIALIAFTLSFDTVAIAFALSRIFPNAGIRTWLQTEYWELAKTGIILVSIYAMIIFVGNLSYHIVPSLVTSQISSKSGIINLAPLVGGAEGYLCAVNSNLTNTWSVIGIMSEGTGFWSTLQVGFYIPIPIGPWVALYDGVSFLPFSNWLLQTGNFMIAWYGSIINDLVNFVLFPFSSIIIGLITTLPSFAYVGITFFIPMGLAFRALPFIRGIGGTLIAIGLALCVVLPSTFILFNYLATNLMASAIPIVQPPPFFAQLSCSSLFSGSGIPGWMSSILCAPITLVTNEINSGVNFGVAIWDSAVVFNTNAIYVYMDRIMTYGLYLLIQMLLLVLDLVIMYPLVDSIARAMGGSIRLSLGGKLRLAS